MKKIILIFALFIAGLYGKAQSIIPQVNENVELMSILSRMAGFQEYHMDMAGQYIKWTAILRIIPRIRLSST